MFGKKKTTSSGNASKSASECSNRGESNTNSKNTSAKTTVKNSTAKACAARATSAKACGGKCKTSNKASTKTTKSCS